MFSLTENEQASNEKACTVPSKSETSRMDVGEAQ